jgi:hypothetical protein
LRSHSSAPVERGIEFKDTLHNLESELLTSLGTVRVINKKKKGALLVTGMMWGLKRILKRTVRAAQLVVFATSSCNSRLALVDKKMSETTTKRRRDGILLHRTNALRLGGWCDEEWSSGSEQGV